MSTDVALSDVSTLLDLGEVSAAYSAAAHLFATADAADLATITRCADMLHQRPNTGVTKLRNAWTRADDERTRAIIAECGKAATTATRAEPQPDRAPRWHDGNKDEAPKAGPVYREHRPELAKQPRQRRKPEPAIVADYAAERAGVAEHGGWLAEPEPAERPDGYTIDYDRAGTAPVRGTVCVSCFIERASRDFRATHDDGLCQQCRESGRPGIPTPPETSRNAARRARCAHLAETYPTAARALLRKEWREANAEDRDTIAAWVQRHRAALDGRPTIPRPRNADQAPHREPAPA